MKENKIYFFIGGFVLVLMLFLIFKPAQAGKYNYYEVNVFPTETTVITGVSDNDLTSGIAAALAGGGHQFDFSTHRWQGSVVGAWDAGESADAVSFGLAKRFETIDALWHGSYTRNDDQDWVTIGASFRF